MAMICDSIPRDKVAEADALLARFGSGYRLQTWIDQIDFDPDLALAQIDTLTDAYDELVEGRPEDCVQLLMAVGVEWTGDARDVACDHIECQRTFWDHVGDFILWLVEQLIQLLDWIVDALRVIVAWITWLAIALALVALAIVVVATLMGIGPGIIAAVVEGPAFAVLGAISLLGTAVSLLLVGLNALFEWLQTIIRDARAKICGDGLPSLPDWDPSGPWFPPLWPQ